MIKDDKERCCGNCRFFLEWSTNGGYCKRYPPTPTGLDEDNSVAYCDPMVRKDDWCGEHQFFPSAVVYVEVNYGRTEK